MKIPWYMRPKRSARLVAGLGGLFTVVNLTFAQNWTATSAPVFSWRTIASSADGAKLVAAGYTTGPYGTITYLLPIYTSTDFGMTWTQTTAPSDVWTSVASSVDGTRFVGVVGTSFDENVGEWLGGGPIYTSADSGATWSRTSAPSNHWSSVASSADGTKLVAPMADGLIYTSTNLGDTWAPTSAPQGSWSSVASSADGSKLVAADWSFAIYTSGDSGVTWMPANVPTSAWPAVASSADGTKLVGVNQGGWVYASSDAGTTWGSVNAPAELWRAVASSADGSKLVAVPSSRYDYGIDESEDAGPIYSLQFPLPSPRPRPSPWLTISRSDARFGISWLVPSTSFALQQNSDLTTSNWTEVPTAPALDFTNYEVTLSASLDRRFYRLKQK
jgi:photosystem II stability/assembly factor-like uncharacterized protein